MTNANEAAPVCQTPPTATRLLKVVALMAIIVAALHLVWAVCDCSQCFTDIEVYSKWMPKIFVAGKSFSWSDLGYAFDSGRGWGLAARFLSIFAPDDEGASFEHPAAAFIVFPVWIFSLLVAPGSSTDSARRLVALIALLGTGLYMVTAGYLSSLR